MAAQTQIGVDSPEAVLKDWVESTVGTVVRIERQGRWRPGWYVEAESETGRRSLYVRGSRGGYWPPQPLSYEAEIHQYLGGQGLKVPPFLGYVEAIPAIVMEVVPGQVDLSTAPESDRETIRRQLAEQMAHMHALDPEVVHGFGSPRAEDDAQLARGYLERVEQIYRATKKRPEPIIEFVLGWLERNTPTTPCPPTVVHVDAGQFMFDGPELVSMIDFELVDVGDRWVDLGALRTRDRAEPIGDLNEFYETYAEIAGVELDMERIRYHGVGVSTLCPMMVAGSLVEFDSQVPYFEYLTWMAFSLKDALEQIAEAKGLRLDPYAPLETDEHSRYAKTFDALEMSVEEMPAADDYAAYVKNNAGLMTRALARVDRFQPALERRYVADVGEILGRSVADWAEADAQIEEFVLQTGEEHEDELLRAFHRRTVGMSLLLADRADWKNKYEWLTEPISRVHLGL
jgi:aminoglycoside phosphotransferase (APT) family kinase protein